MQVDSLMILSSPSAHLRNIKSAKKKSRFATNIAIKVHFITTTSLVDDKVTDQGERESTTFMQDRKSAGKIFFCIFYELPMLTDSLPLIY